MMNTLSLCLMSSLLSKTFRTVALMCHCEAIELFVVLDDMPCFPSHAISYWWAYNMETTKAYQHLQYGTVSSPADVRLLLGSLHG